MFHEGTPADVVEPFAASMRAFHPTGVRAMARASSEDLRHALLGHLCTLEAPEAVTEAMRTFLRANP
jgi:hypothetical protein